MNRLHLWLAIGVLAAAQTAWRCAVLPEQVPIHFGASGRADGWASRDGWLALQLLLWGSVVLPFAALPPLLRSIDPQWINLPHAGYWLAPERKDASIDRVVRWMDGFGAMTAGLIAAITELTVAALRGPDARLPMVPFSAALGGYLLGTVWMIVRLYRRFPAPP